VAALVPPDSPPPLEPAHGRPPASVDELNRRFHPQPGATSMTDTTGQPITVDAARIGPLDAQERTALASLLRRQLPAHEVATIRPPNGHDLTIARLPIPRTGSADAERSTKEERARLEEEVLTTISVPPAAAAVGDRDRHLAAQREVIVKRHKPEYIDAVEKTTGMNVTSRFTVGDLLELKKSTGYVTMS
jgi:hypothetical protein